MDFVKWMSMLKTHICGVSGDMKDWLKIEGSVMLRSLGIKESLNVLDFGCGSGSYTIPSARIVGAKGKVFAVDKNEIVLKNLKKQIRKDGLENIEIINNGDGRELALDEGTVDFVLLFDVLHKFYSENDLRGKIISGIHKVLKEGGKVAVFPKHIESEEFIEKFEKEGFKYEGKVLKKLMHNKVYEEAYIHFFLKPALQAGNNLNEQCF